MRFQRRKAGQRLDDVIRLRGCFEVGLYDPEGRLVEYRKIDNVVVTSGRRFVLSRLQSTSPQAETIGWVAVGTSTTAPATGDTLLVSESLRISISSFLTTGLNSNPPSWQAQCTFATDQANTTLAEAGIFNSSGANVQTMLSHVTYATIDKKTLRVWGRTIVRWLRELFLIDSEAVMPTRANLCCA